MLKKEIWGAHRSHGDRRGRSEGWLTPEVGLAGAAKLRMTWKCQLAQEHSLD